jgi:hypothetical protein
MIATTRQYSHPGKKGNAAGEIIEVLYRMAISIQS